VTIVSTETSGGGLPQYGVFSNEQIFTVFVDMRRTVADNAPSWTFEYAVLKGPAAQGSATSLQRAAQGVVLPFPIIKERPAWSPDVARRHLQRRMIVYAVINVEGRMEQLSVKQSPDPSLNDPVLNALSKWSFRPAQIDGENVTMKVLMGIPIYISQ